MDRPKDSDMIDIYVPRIRENYLANQNAMKMIMKAQEVERELISAKNILGLQSTKDIPQAITKLQDRIEYLKSEIDRIKPLANRYENL